MKFLERIQSKSSSAKGQFAFFGALLITGIIAAVWSTALPVRFSNSVLSTSLEKEDTGLFDILGTAKDQVAALADWRKDLDDATQTNNLDQLGAEEVPPEADAGAAGDMNVGESTELMELSASTTETDLVSTTMEKEPRTILIEIKKSEKTDSSSQTVKAGS